MHARRAIGSGLRAGLLLCAAMALGSPVLAQTAPEGAARTTQQGPGAQPAPERQVVRSPILTLESERLFLDSQLGQRLISQLEAAGQALAAENREIEAELTAEERRLTDLRARTDPAEFRALAEAFDARVQELRQSQDAKARDLAAQGDRVRRVFFSAIQPVLTDILRDAGGALIMERGNVLLSANAIDVTDLAIARVDAQIGAGTDMDLPEAEGLPAPADDGAEYQPAPPPGDPLFDMGDPADLPEASD